ncbi:MAG TPA: efflux RND transporter periplasmic adaptor subunit [Caulobacteraceae bacterium]|jgi:multidrug efflux system membrane fusion protein|nr:efflux RND transporter periplasmic adaptor subunit [Caulobacteraceae bacterium]
MNPPRRFRWGFIPLAVILAGLVVWLMNANHKPAKAKTPSTPVSVTRAALVNMPVFVNALGAAQAWKGVLINPLVGGRLTYVAAEGDYVKPGDVLAEIDCAAYKAALLQAQGALQRDTALLAAAEMDRDRYATLVKQDSIARQQYDDQAALAKQDAGTVTLDRGQVAAAAYNVGSCRMVSPVFGRVGVRLIDPGNIVTTGLTTGIVSVNQIEPIAVTFTIPQGEFQRLAQASSGFTRPLPTEALSQETGADLGAGELVVADNHVDPATGTVQLKARFANVSRQLWPGEFVNVRLTLENLDNVLTIPTAAVNQGPNGAYAFVVGRDQKVIQQPVAVTMTQSGLAVIGSGLKPGDIVVTDGQMSLKPGSKVSYGRGPAPKPAPASSP